MHARCWTRNLAIRWFANTIGSSELDVTDAVDRYSAWPDRARGYKVSHSEINRLRARVQKAPGSKFDLREFDDADVKSRHWTCRSPATGWILISATQRYGIQPQYPAAGSSAFREAR